MEHRSLLVLRLPLPYRRMGPRLRLLRSAAAGFFPGELSNAFLSSVLSPILLQGSPYVRKAAAQRESARTTRSHPERRLRLGQGLRPRTSKNMSSGDISNLTTRFPPAIAQPAPVPHWHDDEPNGHVVQFYSDYSFLLYPLTTSPRTAPEPAPPPIPLPTPHHL